MKILITGANGFLGYHVRQKFSPNDILTPNSKELDILDFNKLNNYLSIHKPHTILHMAAKCGGILANKNNPAEFLRDNLQMGINVYEAARLNNITNIYSLGSVCMYPVDCPVPFKESDIWSGFPEHTNAPYGLSKRTLLMLHKTYCEQYGFTGAFLIPVNLFGTHDNFDLTNSHVIPALIRKFVSAVKDKTNIVECWGSGAATREFLNAADAAEVICKTVSSNFNYLEPINLGTGKEISIKNLAYLIAELTGFTGQIVFNGSVSDGQPRRMLDVSLAKQLLNFYAKTSLRDGLIETIKWYKENR